MLAGHAASAGEAFVQYFPTGRKHALDLLLITFIEQQDGMQVSVSGVKYVHDAHIVLFADFRDASKNVRQFCAWNHSVLGAVTGAQSADGAEGQGADNPR